MSDEQMRIKIAEACGWHEEKEPVGSANATAWWHHNDRYPSYLMPVPDYLNDLNACAEFEAMLTSAERFTYIVELNKLCGDEPSAVWATARQRAEAFLKTLNLWKD